MSFEFSKTSDNSGLAQNYEREIGANFGDVTGNTAKLQEFTSLTRLAFDFFWNIALPASGTWQLDDSNHTKYPIITFNLIASQRDYSFTVDEQSNLILDIYRVFILTSATATTYVEIFPTDAQSNIETTGFTDGENTEGVPYHYDKTANGIFLDPIPSYAATNGLKIYLNREGSYFATTDTTKKPGVPGVLHAYWFLKPAAEYARRNNLANAPRLAQEILKWEGVNGSGGLIRQYFANRARDERHIMTPKRILYI